MSKPRIDLHNILVNLFGNNHVYYQPPDNLRMEYPAIRYSVDRMASTKADNLKYLNTKRYEIIVIDSKPDNPVISKILELPYTVYERHYVSDNLNHDIISLYF